MFLITSISFVQGYVIQDAKSGCGVSKNPQNSPLPDWGMCVHDPKMWAKVKQKDNKFVTEKGCLSFGPEYPSPNSKEFVLRFIKCDDSDKNQMVRICICFWWSTLFL